MSAATATADGSGAFSAKLIIPATAQPGFHSIYASGLTSGNETDHAAFLVRTDWSQIGFNASQTHFNPYENTLSPSNIASGLTSYWKSSSPVEGRMVESGGTIFVASNDGDLQAFDAATGIELWNSTFMYEGWQIAASGTMIYVVGGDYSGNTLYAFHASGCGTQTPCQPVWKTNSFGRNGASEPVVYNGRIYIASGIGVMGVAPQVFIFDARTGSSDGSLLFPDTISGSPAIASGILYYDAFYQGVVYAVDLSTGTTKWTSVTLGTPLSGGGYFYTGPIVSNGKVFQADADGRVYELDANTGHLIRATDTMGSTIWHSPAADSTNIYTVDQMGVVYAFAIKTGTKLWMSSEAPGTWVEDPILANHILYENASNGQTWAFDVTDSGNVLLTVAGGVFSMPIVVNGVLYTEVSADQSLHAYNCPSCL